MIPVSFLRKVSEWKSLLLYSKRVLGHTFSSSLVIGLLLVTTPCALPASLAIKASELSSLHRLWDPQGPAERETHTEGEGPGLIPRCSCPQPPFQWREAEQISDVMMLFCFQCCFGWNQGLNLCLPEPKGPQVCHLRWRPKEHRPRHQEHTSAGVALQFSIKNTERQPSATTGRGWENKQTARRGRKWKLHPWNAFWC